MFKLFHEYEIPWCNLDSWSLLGLIRFYILLRDNLKKRDRKRILRGGLAWPNSSSNDSLLESPTAISEEEKYLAMTLETGQCRYPSGSCSTKSEPPLLGNGNNKSTKCFYFMTQNSWSSSVTHAIVTLYSLRITVARQYTSFSEWFTISFEIYCNYCNCTKRYNFLSYKKNVQVEINIYRKDWNQRAQILSHGRVWQTSCEIRSLRTELSEEFCQPTGTEFHLKSF